MPTRSVPYGCASRYGNDHNEKSYYFAMAAMDAGDKELATRVFQEVKKDCQQQLAYYGSMSEGAIGVGQTYELQTAQQLLQKIQTALASKTK